MMMGTTCTSLAPKSRLPGRTLCSQPWKQICLLILLHQASILQKVFTLHPQLYPSSFPKATAPNRESGFQANSSELGLWLLCLLWRKSLYFHLPRPRAHSTDSYLSELSTFEVWTRLFLQNDFRLWAFTFSSTFISKRWSCNYQEEMRRERWEDKSLFTLMLV